MIPKDVMTKWIRIRLVIAMVLLLIGKSTGSANFSIGAQNYISLTPTNRSATLLLSHTTTDPASCNVSIHALTSNIDVIKGTTNGDVTLSTTDFETNQLDFGVYTITLTFADSDLLSAVVYEVPISGFQVHVSNKIVPVNEDVMFTALFTEASNVEIEWQWNILHEDTEMDNYSGQVTSITKNHTFTRIGDYNITVVAGNSIGRAYTFITITVKYKLNGLTMKNNPGPLPTSQPIYFFISRSETALLPMGTVNISLSYGDEESFFFQFFDSSAAIQLTLSHNYSRQGNFSVIARFLSEISEYVITLDQYVWEDISNVSLTVPVSGNVSENISFTFNNVPRCGFNYKITFGDGTEIESDPTFLNTSNVSPTIRHNYSDIGVYTLHMVAWNPFYSSVWTQVIIIQFPVRNLILMPLMTVPRIMYPIPDGMVEFNYSMIVNNSKPTNVTCIHSFGDSQNIDVRDTDIMYGSSSSKLHTYLNPGIFTVNITCYNKVSIVELITEVEMKSVTGSSFSLRYPLVTGMNMTFVLPVDDFSDPTFLYDPQNVTFMVELFSCVRFPPGFDIEFDFGDETTREILSNIAINDKIQHTYQKRGVFTVTIYVTQRNVTTSRTFNIKMGATDMVISPYSGKIGTTAFTFNVSGVGNGTTYKLTIGPGRTYTLSSEPSSVAQIYTEFTKFYVEVIAYNATFYETTYSTKPVKAELALPELNITIPVKVDLPPGNLLINISIIGDSVSIPYVNCTFLSGDLIDRQLYYKVQNLTVLTPITFPYSYLTLGNHTSVVNCSNTISYISKTVTVNVWNECYQPTGMFDRDYSNRTNPLVLYTSQDNDLGSRMAVYCTDQHVNYEWMFYTEDEIGTFIVEYPYYPAIPANGRIRFAKGTIGAHTYRVTLNVTLDKTWVYEPTFVKFVNVPPFVIIQGGDFISIKLSKLKATFDALTGSYDVMYGIGANQNLNFEWSCREFNTLSIDVLKQNYDTALKNSRLELQPNCMPKLEQALNNSNGILTLDLVDYPTDAGYAVTVQVALGELNSTYTQLLQARTSESPDVGIECMLNCDQKYAIKLKSMFQAVCFDCEPEEISYVNFEWSLKKNSLLVSSEVFTAMTLTGITSRALSLRPDVIEPNNQYELWVAAWGGWGRTNNVTKTGRTISPNLPPYGGTCAANPLKGNSTSTPFAIYCSGFLDEGLNPSRDVVRDKAYNNPLRYRYFVVDKYMNADKSYTAVRTIIFSSAEMSATEISLPLGNPELDYNVTLEVEVSDRFGDYCVYETKVKVSPDTTLQPFNESDVNAIEKLFSNFNDSYAITKHGGNAISVVRLCMATASMYSHVDVKEKRTDSVDTGTTPGNKTVVANPLVDNTLIMRGQSDVQEKVKKENKRLVKIINDSVRSKDSNSRLLPGDCNLAARSLQIALTNTDVVTDEISVTATTSSNLLLKNIQAAVNKKPFPIDELASINSSTSGIMSALDANLNYIFVNDRIDLSIPITLESVKKDILSYYDFNPDKYVTEVGSDTQLSELVKKVYQQKLYKRERQIERANATSRSTVDFFDAINTALDITGNLVQYGENATTIEKSNIYLSVEKHSIQHFIDRGKIERDGAFIVVSNITVENNTNQDMQLQVAVFKMSPVPHAKGDDKITSKVLRISTKMANNETIDLNIEVTLTNEIVAHFVEHTTVINHDDPDRMIYFIIKIRDTNDSVAVFKMSPVPHAKGDDKITSKVLRISTKMANNETIDLNIEVTLTNEIVAHFVEHTTVINPDDPDRMIYFMIKIRDTNDSVITYVNLTGDFPTGMPVIYTAYFKSSTYPSSISYDYKHDASPADLDSTGLKIFVPEGICKPAKCYLGLQRRSVEKSISVPFRRKKRDVNTPTNSTEINPVNANFSIVIATTGCRSYNERLSTWEANGCTVLPFSTLNETVCRCQSSTRTLATTFFVAPNTIDFNNVFNKFDVSNAAVYGTLIALLVLFIIFGIWLRKKDKKDQLRWAIRFLCDCDSEDQYFYIISIYTGLRPGAGTNSNVNFVLAGEKGDTGVRLLSDGIEHGFECAGVRNFVLSTNVVLGELTYFRVWHDNSGIGNRNSWFLFKVIVDDPQTNRRYVFHCDRWLSVDYDDGMIERIIPVANPDELEIKSLFYQQTKLNMTENHLWMSLFIRPSKSVFTRIQRLGCGVALLLLTMISNAMFFRSADEQTVSANTVQLGFLKLSLSNLYISIIGIMITTPPIAFASFVFRNIASKGKPLPFQQNKTRNHCLPCSRSTDLYCADDEDFIIRKKRKFPYWVGFVAWCVLILSSAVSAFFLLLYSMEWGKDKSEDWLSTFILSFFESLVFVDPLKVIIMAFLIALLVRKHVDDETTLVDMTKLRLAASKHSSRNARLFWAFRHEVLSKGEPLPQDELKKQRNLRKQEMKAKQIFHEVILHIMFVIIVYCIGYVNRDNRAHAIISNLDNLLVTPSTDQIGFSQITRMEDLVNWMSNTLVPAFYPVHEYNGASLSLQDKFYIDDHTNIRLGLVRLRQVRMPEEECDYNKLTPNIFCTSDYQSSKEENRDFCVSWKPKNESCSLLENSYFTKDSYSYKTSSELHGIPFAGEYDVYGTGGYIQDLPNNRDSVNDIINEINTYKWLDRRTRAVIIEFSVYNSNINLIASATYLVEFTVTGSVLANAFTQVFRPSLLTDATGGFSIVCYVAYLIALLITSVKTVQKLRDKRCAFFNEAWNCIDVLTCILSYSAIGVWVVRYIETSKALERYYNDKSGFINFSEIVTWDSVFNSIIGIVVFTAQLRILSALGYNKKMAEIVHVIRHAARDLLSFSVIYGIAFFGFVILGFLLFGSSISDYRDLLQASGSMVNTLIGRNSLDQMVVAGPYFAQFYFFCYVLFVVFILLTMFAAILNQSITAVRQDTGNEAMTIGLLDLIQGTLNDLLGTVGIHIRRNNRRSKHVSKKYQMSVIKKNAQIDAQNIIQLVRDTFGNFNENEPDIENTQTKTQKFINDFVVTKENEKYLIDISPETERISSACTPRDIDFGFAYPIRENSEPSVYNSF